MKPAASRRFLLKGGLAAATTGLLAPGTAPTTARSDVTGRLRELEESHEARLGVYGQNVRTGATIRYRAGERFAICSVFKGMLAGHVLRDYDRESEFLERMVRYTEEDLAGAGFSDITKRHLCGGMTVRELCAAAIEYSDNGATNLLMRSTDGPHGVTTFCRSIGDAYTRIDRWEPEMSSAIPGDVRDTTTPEAVGGTFAELTLGRVLSVKDRTLLKSWLLGNTTSANRFHVGLPDHWEIGDKTGTGDYGAANNVGIVWTTKGTPLVLSVLTTKSEKDAEPDERLIAETAHILAHELAPGE